MIEGETSYDGFVKMRLVHGRGRSLVIADHVVITGSGSHWLQPQWVYASMLFVGDQGYTPLHLALANKWNRDIVVRVEVHAEDFVTDLVDRSQVYRCRVFGPENLRLYAAGRARVRDDGGFNLRLYHHTTREAKSLIRRSQHIRGSAWNFQGTRELENVAYAYFTSLDRVASEEDLVRIAMSGKGRLPLRLDQAPSHAPPDLVLDVYTGRLKDRAHRVPLWVPAEHVSPSHIYQHTTGVIEYEMAHPWIYRVGLEPGGNYHFSGDRAEESQDRLKRFDYVVLGDCTTLAGLRAPYDEDITGETFEVQDVGGKTVFEFWRDHGNHQLFTGTVEKQTFAT